MRRSRQALRVRKARAKDVPAVVVAIAIAGVADEDAVREEVLEEVTVVATPAAAGAGAGEGKTRVAS